MEHTTETSSKSKPEIDYVHPKRGRGASGETILDNINISVDKGLTVTALSTAESMFMTLANELRTKRNELAAVYWEKEAGILAELKRQILIFSGRETSGKSSGSEKS